jgi:DNA-binding phage protein
MPAEAEPIDLGPRLRALIERKGHRSIRAAAKAAGVNYEQLHTLMQGNKSPRLDTLDRIVTALGGTLAELFAAPDSPPMAARARGGSSPSR